LAEDLRRQFGIMMMKPALLALAGLLAASSSVAFAEDEVTPTPTPTPAATPMTPSSGGPFQKGAMGISTGIAGGFGASYIVDFAYFLSDKAAVDIFGGLQLVHTPDTSVAPAASNAVTAFGFAAGIGYRMYTHKGQTIHTYIQPFGLLQSTDVGHAADTFAIAVGANFGAEAFVNDWLSFRGQIGAALNASSIPSKTLQVIGVGTTTGAFVNVYWK
jgi:hypothetical protein